MQKNYTVHRYHTIKFVDSYDCRHALLIFLVYLIIYQVYRIVKKKIFFFHIFYKNYYSFQNNYHERGTTRLSIRIIIITVYSLFCFKRFMLNKIFTYLGYVTSFCYKLSN